MNIWTITHVNGLVSPIHEEGQHGQEYHGQGGAFSIKARALRQHVVFVGILLYQRFELVAGAQQTLYVQLYVLEVTERQRIGKKSAKV
jgi:hypothetical protein